MYSEAARPKINKMFHDIKLKADVVIDDSNSSQDAVDGITKLVASETARKVRSILSDMLYDLEDGVMADPFFKDVARQNRFMEANLRQEILDKYRFETNMPMDYKSSGHGRHERKVGAAKTGVAALAVCGVGMVLVAGLTSITPVSVGVLIAVASGAALADYLVISPGKYKESLKKAANSYLNEAWNQLASWFDEVEKYYNARVSEIKKSM